MATQEERRAQTRQKILIAAAGLFKKDGFDNTTLAQILAQADVVKGTFYQHFDTKTDLLMELGRQEGADKVLSLIDKVEQGLSPSEALQRYYLVFAQWFEANAPIAEDVIVSAIRRHDPKFNRPEHSAHAFTKLMVEVGQQRGEFRQDISAMEMAFVLGGAFTLAVVSWGKKPKKKQLQSYSQNCLTVFMQGAQS